MIIKKVKYLFEGYNLKIPKELDDLMLSEIRKHKGEWNDATKREYRAGVLAAYWANPKMPGEIKTIQGSGNILQELQPTLKQSIMEKGELWDKNPFLKVLGNIEGSPSGLKDMPAKLNYLYRVSKNNNYDLNNKWYTNRGLYERNLKDFRYSVTALEMLNNPTEVRKHFDYKLVNMDKLYYPDGKLKTASDIYNQIEEWQATGDKGSGTKSNKYSLNDYLKSVKLKLDNKGEIVHDLDAIKNNGEKVELINNFLYLYGGTKYDKSEKAVVNSLEKYVEKKLYLNRLISENTFNKKENAATNVAQQIIKDIYVKIGDPESRKAFTIPSN